MNNDVKRNNTYLKIEELLEEYSGFIGFRKSLPMTIDNEGTQRKLSICAVVLKHDYYDVWEDKSISINNVALITKERNGYHAWDMNDYLTTTQMSDLLAVIHKELE